MTKRLHVARDGRIYDHKETQAEFYKRRLKNELRKNSVSPYLASDNGLYERKETQIEYMIRKILGRRFSGSPRSL